MELRVEALLGRPVLLRGINLGHVVDVLLNLEPLRAVGVEVRSPDGEERFLPLAVAELVESALHITSPFGLLDRGEAGFYRAGTVPWRLLRGTAAGQAGYDAGALADILLDSEGVARECVITTEDGGSRTAPAAAVRLAGPRGVSSPR